MKKLFKIFIITLLAIASMHTLNTKLETKVHAAPSDDFVYTVKGVSTKIELTGGSYTVKYTDPLGTVHVTPGVPGMTLSFPSATATTLTDIRISGTFDTFRPNYATDNLGNIVDVKQWGTTVWAPNGFVGMFFGCSNLVNITATDTPNLTNVTNFTDLFKFATNFNGNINNWNTSNVTNMSRTFYGASYFNQPLNNWNTSNVTNMSNMFNHASKFNQPLNNWNTSNVTDMTGMFSDAIDFNQSLNNWNVGNVTGMSGMFSFAENFNGNISNWNTSNVISMSTMFFRAKKFNQPLDNWNVGNVTSMYYMFCNAHAFNQPLNNWHVNNVTDMSSMFNMAKSFNQPLNNWDVRQVSDMSYMFANSLSFNQPLNNWDVSNTVTMVAMLDGSKLSIENFDATLKGWDALPSVLPRTLGVSTMLYTEKDVYQNLIAKGWIMNGLLNSGEMKIIKVDRSNVTKQLPGAEFEIFDSFNRMKGKVTTGINGDIIIKNLPLGNYTLKETVAPVGYDIDTTPIPVTLTVRGATVDVSVGNSLSVGQNKIIQADKEDTKKRLVASEKKGVSSLPKTGNELKQNKTFVHNLYSIVLIAMFLFIAFIARTKRNKNVL